MRRVVFNYAKLTNLYLSTFGFYTFYIPNMLYLKGLSVLFLNDDRPEIREVKKLC